MAKQLITIGTPGAGGGDPAHAAFKKINDNASELYDAAIPDTEEKKTQARANLGLGAAATRAVGTDPGQLMEVGAFGLGGREPVSIKPDTFKKCLMAGVYIANDPAHNNIRAYLNLAYSSDWIFQIRSEIAGDPEFRFFTEGTTWGSWFKFRTELNTAVDGNGFVKAASPIVKLFVDKIELNHDAQQQDIVYEILGVGDYLLKGSTGFAQQGWYVETPKDANGNALVAVVYEQLENQDISVKTYKKKFDIESASIVADLNSPIDIPEGRWIDIRLQELPQPEFVPPVAHTPADFQPTGIAKAVSEMMNGTEQ